MIYELEIKHRNVSSDELLSDLRSVAKRVGKNGVTMQEYNTYGKYNSSTLIRRFGSWFKCLDAAGLEYSRSKIGISDSELFENLERIWRLLGRQPRYSEVRKPISYYSVSTYEKKFGTYGNALKAFVETINESSGSSNATINDNSNIKKQFTSNPRAINYRTRFLVMQRDGFKCRLCGASPSSDPSVQLQIDHIIPCAKGGTADFNNLQTLCSKCNLGKSDLNLNL